MPLSCPNTPRTRAPEPLRLLHVSQVLLPIGNAVVFAPHSQNRITSAAITSPPDDSSSCESVKCVYIVNHAAKFHGITV